MAQNVPVVQWNVLEDGLADTPSAVGFAPDFRAAFETLLRALGGDTFFTFAQTRDFTELPRPVPVVSVESFVGSLDCVYNIVYHVLGGEAQLDHLPLRNSLRSLFLHMSLANSSAPPGPTNGWSAPDFEIELERATAEQSTGAADAVRAVRDAIVDGRTGGLEWDRSVGQRISKRGTVALNKWLGLDSTGAQLVRGLRVFIDPPCGATDDPPTAAALARFLRVRPLGTPSPHDGEDEHAGRPLVEVLVDATGNVARLRTASFQSGMRTLVDAICDHGERVRGHVHARAAVAAFCGMPDLEEERSAWVCAIFSKLSAAVDSWSTSAGLASRHACFCRTLLRTSPALVTLVEFDDAWRSQPLPTAHGRRYVIVHGRGAASVLFDAELFERAELPSGIEVPPHARSAKERGDAAEAAESALAFRAAPKSSCIVLLRRLVDGLLFLVCAAHLESGKPSDTVKVALRAHELRAMLIEIEGIVADLERCVIIVGGDLNALREEFVSGNSDAFFDAPAVAAVRPTLKRPAANSARSAAPQPPIGRLGSARGELQLACAPANGGWLVEASDARRERRDADMSCCSRAGSSMVIDFVLVGSIGSLTVETEELQVVPDKDVAAAADAADGVRHAVTCCGSDHLPVGCNLYTAVRQP